MVLIKQIVQKALDSGCLTVALEAELCNLFDCQWDLEDINALEELRRAVETGVVKREMEGLAYDYRSKPSG
jgi:hypothetical protein